MLPIQSIKNVSLIHAVYSLKYLINHMTKFTKEKCFFFLLLLLVKTSMLSCKRQQIN